MRYRQRDSAILSFPSTAAAAAATVALLAIRLVAEEELLGT